MGIRAVFIKGIIAFIGRLPVSVLRGLGWIVGLLHWLAGSRLKNITSINVSQCFPQSETDELRQLVRNSLIEDAKTLFESCRYWTLTRERCLADIETVNDEKLRELLLKKPDLAIVFIIPHLGNWELINHYLGKHYGLTHMYQPAKSPVLDQVVLGKRRRSGNRFVTASLAGIRSQHQALQAKKHIGCMPDQEPEISAGVFVPFFGISALTGKLVAHLCQSDRVLPVIATCCRISGKLGSRFEISLNPLEGLEYSSLPAASRRINQAIETVIREIPVQYLWSYKRFRTRPPGEAELYEIHDHALKRQSSLMLISLLLSLTRYLSLSTCRRIGKGLGRLSWMLGTQPARITSINLDLCLPYLSASKRQGLLKESVEESGKALLETGLVWKRTRTWLKSCLLNVDEVDRVTESFTHSGTLVLIPPLGNREVVISYLASHYPTNEYYHPHPISAVDDLIRQQRYHQGVALYPHTGASVDQLCDALCKKEIVILCPDQQPRLKNGIFVPFFDHPALTLLAMTALASPSVALLYIGVAVRLRHGFQLSFTPLRFDRTSQPADQLASINSSLEKLILQFPAQYRWSDRRFNIQPKGKPKPYLRAE